MKRLVLIHGINNQDNSAEVNSSVWWNAIKEGWTALGLSTPADIQVDAAFYGGILADGTNKAAIAMGDTDPVAGTAAMEFIEAYRDYAGLTAEEVTAAVIQSRPGASVVEQGKLRAFLVQAAKEVSELLADGGHGIAKGFLEQAAAYIDDANLRATIHSTVNDQVFAGKSDPTVVIGHSLGSVVGYNVMCDRSFQNDQRTIPLFVTLGSPLGIQMMRSVIPARRKFPNPPIGDWLNAFRSDDFVPLATTLTDKTIGFNGIANERTKLVRGVDPHSITAYLKAPVVARRLHEALA